MIGVHRRAAFVTCTAVLVLLLSVALKQEYDARKARARAEAVAREDGEESEFERQMPPATRQGYLDMLHDTSTDQEQEHHLSIDPLTAGLMRAHAKVMLGRYDSGLKDFAQVKASYPDTYGRTSRCAEIVRALWERGLEDEARAMAEDALRNFPENRVVTLVYAELLASPSSVMAGATESSAVWQGHSRSCAHAEQFGQAVQASDAAVQFAEREFAELQRIMREKIAQAPASQAEKLERALSCLRDNHQRYVDILRRNRKLFLEKSGREQTRRPSS